MVAIAASAVPVADAQFTGGTSAPQATAAPSTNPAPQRNAARTQQKQDQATGRRRQHQQQQEQSAAAQPSVPTQRQPVSPRQPPDVQQQQVVDPQPAAIAPAASSGFRHPRNRARRDTSPPPVSFSQATQRQHHQRHDRAWWASRFPTIVFVQGCGHYYFDAGYWFPAFGYDPGYENYDYNGPIYTYGNLLPDQVIYNVQRALKELGYYSGPLNASLGPGTRAAIRAFQEDNGLDVTGAIDAPTIEALGLD